MSGGGGVISEIITVGQGCKGESWWRREVVEEEKELVESGRQDQ